MIVNETMKDFAFDYDKLVDTLAEAEADTKIVDLLDCVYLFKSAPNRSLREADKPLSAKWIRFALPTN